MTEDLSADHEDLGADHEAAGDLRHLAKAVIDGQLCGCLLFSVFVRSFLEDTGGEPSYWARKIARQVGAELEAGIHAEPEEIAHRLLSMAEQLESGLRGDD
jgi:hypothetical protein